MRNANRFRFDPFSDELLAFAGLDDDCFDASLNDEEILGIGEPNWGCVGEYGDALDDENDDVTIW